MEMIPWSPAVMDRGLAQKQQRGLMNSIFVSAANAASNMLATAASSAMVPGGGERWRATDNLRYFVMLTIWGNVWILRLLTNAFPSSSSVALSLLDSNIDGLVVKRGQASSSSADLVVHGKHVHGVSRPPSTTAIGRALSHILGILSEMPAMSRKYEYVLATADRIVIENMQCGYAALLEVNRTVLASAFSRTCDLLHRSLERSEASTAAWTSRVLRLIPMGDRLRPYLGGLLPLPVDAPWRSSRPGQPQGAATSAAVSSSEWLKSEKLAHELLWITNKLRACSAAGEAIARWAFASGLASLTLTAHPRVQGAMVKITVMLYRELGREEWEAAREVRFGVLALWLPLLCYASNGVTSPVLTGAERWEMERVMEDLIAGLPWDEQEIILRNWLGDFSSSDSDWPNLGRSFDRWCRHSGKLLL